MLIPYGVIYQETALPMYAISTIEVALHPLGIVSHSFCDFEPFLDAILNFERVMEFRIGVVRAIELYSNKSHTGLLLLIGFLNGRGFENWVRLDLLEPISWVSPCSTSIIKDTNFQALVPMSMERWGLCRFRGFERSPDSKIVS